MRTIYFRTQFLLLMSVAFLLVSAKTDDRKEKAPVSTTISTQASATNVKTKTSFFKKLKNWLFNPNTVDVSKADKSASRSLSFGIATWVAVGLGILIPGVSIVAIPLAIVAIVNGNSALKNGTQLEGKAQTGKWLGWGYFIILGVAFILVLIAFSNWH